MSISASPNSAEKEWLEQLGPDTTTLLPPITRVLNAVVDEGLQEVCTSQPSLLQLLDIVA
jgi:hypothetical protein